MRISETIYLARDLDAAYDVTRNHDGGARQRTEQDRQILTEACVLPEVDAATTLTQLTALLDDAALDKYLEHHPEWDEDGSMQRFIGRDVDSLLRRAIKAAQAIAAAHAAGPVVDAGYCYDEPGL